MASRVTGTGTEPRSWWTRAGAIAGLYAVITLGMTWPLAADLGSSIAWDLGDPVFNSWVMLWTGGQVLAALRGDTAALHQYWHGNIFHPSSTTIAFSEHMTPQMLQGLPILAATGNILLVYNLLFLSTFVLSGLGAYLLVREITKRPAAAFLAGLAFAFAPYRIAQYSHLQVLSAQWMPFALYGFHRYFSSGRTRPLVGGSAALLLQNLSCGYHLLFFSPVAAAYCVFEMTQRGLLRSVRTWRALLIAAAGVGLATWPFLLPYLSVRTRGDVGVRSYEEALLYSADVYAFGTAAAVSALWGGIVRAFPRGEGELFPGFTILAFALVALVAGAAHALRRMRVTDDAVPRRWALAATAGALAISVGALLWMLLEGSLPILVEGRPWRDSTALLIGSLVFALIAFAISPAARRGARGAPGSALAFYAVAALVTALLALGPRLQSAGQMLGSGPYALLLHYIPGFDGVRVPARYFMVTALCLSVMAGLGAAWLLARARRAGIVLVAVGCAFVLAESWVWPMPMNMPLAVHGYAPTPRRLMQSETMSPLYRTVRDAPGKVVLIEFPFADLAYEIMATYYAGLHRRPLVNGYSGFFPEDYLRRATFLTHIPFDLDAATRAVQSSGATHALVHEAAFPRGRGHEVTDWLVSTGATITGTFGADKLLTLAPRPR